MGSCLSKWITDTVHLRTLVKGFECIMAAHRLKTYSMGSMPEFVKKATLVLNQESPSEVKLQELQNILQEISSMNRTGYFPMKQFLGDRRQIIGGTRRSWTSGKMRCFLMKVVNWNGEPNNARSFKHDKKIYSQGVTSDDIQRDSPTLGKKFRNEIHGLWLECGCSEYSSLSRPLNTHRSALNSPRQSVADATPRDHLCTAPPLPHSFVLKWFMSNGPRSLNATKRMVCPNMLAPYHPCLKQLYDMVTYYQRFREAILAHNPLTLAPFFERVSKCWHIQIVLASSPLFISLQHVAFANNWIQNMFLEGLVFSILNEYNLSIRLGISKIVRNPDGKRFSIELFPEEMIRDYIRRSHPSIIGEQASMA